ncbi:MAG TPA: helix-turn-helix domain-containing protein [Patescibacteria group bacterium]|nr:helix-turn-helix domain-containing protein [Patescibacteria group bacterium]
MQKTIQLLKTLGLDEREAKTYLTALEIGSSTIAYLAKKTGVKRTSLYVYIEDMIARGLISITVSGKRKLYEALEPEGLEALIERQKEAVDILVPELLLLSRKSPEKPRIRFYEKEEGLKHLFNESLNQAHGSEILCYSNYEEYYKVFDEKFTNDYIARRVAKEISVRTILTENKLATEITKKQNKKELREIITVPYDKLPIAIEMHIYENKLAIMSFGNERIGVLIESPQIVNTQRAIFNLLWEKLETDEKPPVPNVVKAPITIL